MAPFKHPLKTEEEGKEQKNHLLADFFLRMRKGRPRRKGNFASDCIHIAKQGRAVSAAVDTKPVMHSASNGLTNKTLPSEELKEKKA